VSIFLPPLRERKEDIPLLIGSFLQKYNQQFNKECHRLSSATLQGLMDYDWPGNVREMENLIKRIVIMGGEEAIVRRYLDEGEHRKKIRPKSVPSEPPAADLRPAFSEKPREPIRNSSLPPLKHVAREAMKKAEGEVILMALEQTRWNRKAAARLLKISYKALLYKIRQCNLDGEPGPSEPLP